MLAATRSARGRDRCTSTVLARLIAEGGSTGRRGVGLTAPLPPSVTKAFEGLSEGLVEACLRVCQQIASPAVTDNVASEEGAQEATLWLLFGCKFVQRIVGIASRPNSDGENRLKHLLKMLRGLETSLPSE